MTKDMIVIRKDEIHLFSYFIENNLFNYRELSTSLERHQYKIYGNENTIVTYSKEDYVMLYFNYHLSKVDICNLCYSLGIGKYGQDYLRVRKGIEVQKKLKIKIFKNKLINSLSQHPELIEKVKNLSSIDKLKDFCTLNYRYVNSYLRSEIFNID